ncbi:MULTISPECIES: hypothetical protein [Moorena]|nr:MULTISPECIES: hypothetical protein [Moorena]NEP34122.1 hypothetical protein [Moorena sp. SIO3B2]NEP67124.1 hypothetical protein [Moorena sp. SIO3A5]NEQ06891.1 hypothetical protein [Moorena sp. SIO4E2]NER88779.1 hypothetical protein [Moorena sp. SIO3A2]NES45445.1 hypothetical protein [Moorena sp. SIO2C4]
MSPPATSIYWYCCHCRQQMPMLEETILTESVSCGDIEDVTASVLPG